MTRAGSSSLPANKLVLPTSAAKTLAAQCLNRYAESVAPTEKTAVDNSKRL